MMRALSKINQIPVQPAEVTGSPVVTTGVIAAGAITSAQVSDTVISAPPRMHIDKAVAILCKAWRTLRHLRTPQDRMWVIGHIEAFRDLDVLNETEYKGWLLQIETCPGHDEGFNPADCAYCAPKA